LRRLALLNPTQPRRNDALLEIATTLSRDLKRQLYPRKYFIRLRSLDRPAEKLVYLFLLLAQPQTFASVRRLLGLGNKTVARCLKKLVDLRLVILDENFIYWTSE